MIYALGFLAQICFSARLLIQWIISEKENLHLEFEHEKQLAKDSGTHPLHSPHNPDRSHRIYVSRGKRVHQSIFLQ